MANIKKIILNGTTYNIVDSTAVHTVDTAISSSSTNPVQNKVIKAALDKKGTLISLSTATATALLDYYSFSVPAADITAINAAHDGVIISFGSSSAFGANETFVGFLNETTLWNGITYLAYSGTISAATSLDSNLFVLLLPKTGNGGTGYIKAKNVATKGDIGDALDDAEDYADTKIVAAIEALDAAVSGLGTGKTITALSETDGVISAEASDIAIAGKQVEGGATQYYGTCATAAGTAAKVVTCPGFVLVAGARISVKFTNGSTSSSIMTLNVNSTGAKYCGVYLYSGTWQTYANRCEKNEVLEFIYDGTYWVTLTPYALRNFGNYGSRLTSANVSWSNGGLQYFLATSSMTTGKPPISASILNMNWDNSSTNAAQLAVGVGSSTVATPGRIFSRGQLGTAATWSDWKEVPRLSSPLTNGQIVVSDESTGNALLKGGPALDTTDTTKFLRHDGSWAEVGGGVAPVEDSDVFLSRAVNFGENKYKFPSLVGGTVAWKQLITASNKSKTTTPNGTATYSFTSVSCSIQANHIYVIGCDITYNGTLNPLRLYVQIGSVYGKPAIDATSANKRADWLIKPTANSTALTVGVSNVATSAKLTSADAWSYNNLTVIDLTLALGPTIADYIYSLETATAGAGVQWFKQYFPKSYYPYNAGTLVSVNPTGVKTVNANWWNNDNYELQANNGITKNGVNGLTITQKGYQENLNKLPITWTTKPIRVELDYKVLSTTNASAKIQFRFYYTDGTYSSGVISAAAVGNTGHFSGLSTSGKTVAYVCFGGWTYGGSVEITNLCVGDADVIQSGVSIDPVSHSYPISPVELRGILKLDANNKLYCDGDVRASDGTVTRKYGIVDMGTLSWSYGNNGGQWPNSLFYASVSGKAAPYNRNMICSKYVVSEWGVTSSDLPDKSITVSSGAYVYVRDFAYTTAAAFKTALSGVYLVYELATPTTESSAALPVPQVVYDGGTESYIDERDVQMPVGQNATYMDATNAIGELMDSGLVPSSSGGSSYFEGTFTAKYGTVSNTWNYYKEGNTVTVWGSISNATSMAAAVMTGLPFAARHKQVVSATCSGGSYICVSMDIRIESGSTQFAPSQMTYASTSGTSVQVMNSETMIFYTIGNTATLRFTYICQ